MSDPQLIRKLSLVILLGLLVACGVRPSEGLVPAQPAAKEPPLGASEVTIEGLEPAQPATYEPSSATSEATISVLILRVPMGDVPKGAVIDVAQIEQSFKESFLSGFPGVTLTSLSLDDGILIFTFSGAVTQELCEQVYEAFGAPKDCPEGLPVAGPTTGSEASATVPSPTALAPIPTPDITLAATSVERILPSVVLIQSQHGAGTGFFISNDGYILTNAHVVEGSTEFEITLYDGRSFDGRLVGQVEGGGKGDAPDVGVLKIEASELAVVEFGDPSTLTYGTPILTVGHPGGYGYWLATGGKYLGRQGKNIVADVPNAKGSSGAPMFTQNGEVIGLLWGERGLAVESEVPHPPATIDIVWSFEEFQSRRENLPSSWGVAIDEALFLAEAIIARQGNVRYQEFLSLPNYTVVGDKLIMTIPETSVDIPSFTEAINVTILSGFPGFEIKDMNMSSNQVTVTFNKLPPEQALTAILEFFAAAAVFEPTPPIDLKSAGAPQSYPSPPEDDAAVTVALEITPSVVVLNVIGARFESGGEATGFIISSDGYILTNSHNVNDVEPPFEITVTLFDERIFPGVLIGYDLNQDPDVAVIKIEAVDLPVVELGNAADLEVGETLVVVGNPGGYSHWIVTGGEYLGRVAGDLVCSNSGSEGSSGSPVVNLDGQVVGLLYAGQSTPDLQVSRTLDEILWSWAEFWALTSHGLLAVPISEAMNIANQIIATGGNVP
ncbi:MAG: trypsin-like peptidase domain-containing protein [Chloroflexota bacterium]